MGIYLVVVIGVKLDSKKVFGHAPPLFILWSSWRNAAGRIFDSVLSEFSPMHLGTTG